MSDNATKKYYQRLGYFLIMNAFLVAGFVQLVTADTNNALISEPQINFLVHSIAMLGSFISALYSYMNLMVWIRRWDQVIHTFIIPASFLTFWLVAWYVIEHWWRAFLIIGIIIVLFIIFEIFGKPIFRRKHQRSSVSEPTSNGGYAIFASQLLFVVLFLTAVVNRILGRR